MDDALRWFHETADVLRSTAASIRVRHWVSLAAAFASLVVMAGCAERQLVAGPDEPLTSATWAPVGVACAMVALVIGVLLALPAWRTRGGSRLAVTILSAHAGGIALGGTVLAAVAVRSWQLIGRPADAEPEPAILRITGADGDTGYFALMLLFVVIVGGLLTLIVTLAARLAGTEDPIGRSVACAVLGVEILVAGYALARYLNGEHDWFYVVGALHVPLAMAALMTCWPGHGHPSPRPVADPAA